MYMYPYRYHRTRLSGAQCFLAILRDRITNTDRARSMGSSLSPAPPVSPAHLGLQLRQCFPVPPGLQLHQSHRFAMPCQPATDLVAPREPWLALVPGDCWPPHAAGNRTTGSTVEPVTLESTGHFGPLLSPDIREGALPTTLRSLRCSIV